MLPVILSPWCGCKRGCLTSQKLIKVVFRTTAPQKPGTIWYFEGSWPINVTFLSSGLDKTDTIFKA